jgi:cell division protein ZapE
MEPVAAAYQARLAAGALRPDEGQSALIPKLDALAAALAAARPKPGLRGLFGKAPPAPRGLYIWGGVGRGKSMLMDLFFATADTPKRRVHFHAFMQEVQSGIARARKAGAEDAIRPVADAVAADVRLLCFDEMQVTDIADAMIVGRLFELLFAQGVTVVTTSNRPPADLYRDGLNRALFLPFIALMEDRLEVVHLESPTDYRRHVLDGAPVWFVPADREAARRIEAVWQGLTGGEPAAPLVLTVAGRAVTLPQARSGVARATFWDLCAKPLGPADYLAIAGAVRVLILEDIPVLSSANYNEAKRFVTLIDTLYEARVRLIASAADEPERLYIEGAGSFEFERTASRLREMQGAGWGQGQ